MKPPHPFKASPPFYEPWEAQTYLTIPDAIQNIRMYGHPTYKDVDFQEPALARRIAACVNALAGVDLDNLTESQKFALLVLRTNDLTGAKALIDKLTEDGAVAS